MNFAGLLVNNFFAIFCRIDDHKHGSFGPDLLCSTDMVYDHRLPEENPVNYPFFRRMGRRENYQLGIVSINGHYPHYARVFKMLTIEVGK